MTVTLTILGCGSSAGVPRPALGWGACDPKNPKNRRRRCSLLVERTGAHGTTRIVIDTSPDLREQLIDAEVDHIDALGAQCLGGLRGRHRSGGLYHRQARGNVAHLSFSEMYPLDRSLARASALRFDGSP